MRAPATPSWQTVWITASLTLSGYLAWQTLVGPEGWRHHARLQKALAEQHAAHDALEAEAGALQRRIDALEQNPTAQEHAVRDRLGWLRPGEVMVHFPAEPQAR